MTDVDPLVAVIDEGWRAVERRVAAASTAADRDPATVRVVAVTKGFGPEVVAAAWHAGLTRFGENRVQEAETKLAAAGGREAALYAEGGFWYDAIGTLSSAIAASPQDATLRGERALLLEQAGLSEVAAYDRAAAAR